MKKTIALIFLILWVQSVWLEQFPARLETSFDAAGRLRTGSSAAPPQSFRLYLPLIDKNYPDAAAILNSCQRPYQDTSLWNTPIDWNTARIHPESAQMMAAFFASSASIGADPSQYTPNIYFVNHQTPLVPVKLWSSRSFRDAINDVTIVYSQPGATIYAPIPANALPSPGVDGELVVVNLDTGEEWGISKGKIDYPGHWYVGGLYRYHVWNSGVPPAGFAQRGAGIGALAGIVRPCEVERGEIPHAVTLAYDYPCAASSCVQHGYPAFVAPFTRTDGSGTARYDLPEGAHLAIRPEITDGQIQQACAGVSGCAAWAKAMRTYGGYIVDKSGHPKTYPEGSLTAGWNPSMWSDKMLQNIPQAWYIVLDWNVP